MILSLSGGILIAMGTYAPVWWPEHVGESGASFAVGLGIGLAVASFVGIVNKLLTRNSENRAITKKPTSV